jgi:hypothetical protein
MPDIFDQITAQKPKGDIFDQIGDQPQQPKTDIFDHVAAVSNAEKQLPGVGRLLDNSPDAVRLGNTGITPGTAMEFASLHIQHEQNRRGAPLSVPEQLAIQDIYKQASGRTDTSNQNFGKQINDNELATRGESLGGRLQNFAGGVDEDLANTGLNFLGEIAPQYARGLQQNTNAAYETTPGSVAAKAGMGVAEIGKLLALKGASPTTIGALFGSQGFGRERIGIANQRAAGADIGLGSELATAGGIGVAEGGSGYLLGTIMDKLAPLVGAAAPEGLLAGESSAVRKFVTDGIKTLKLSLAEGAQNAVATGVENAIRRGVKPEQALSEGVLESFVTGTALAPIGAAMRGHGGEHVTTDTEVAPAAEPTPAAPPTVQSEPAFIDSEHPATSEQPAVTQAETPAQQPGAIVDPTDAKLREFFSQDRIDKMTPQERADALDAIEPKAEVTKAPPEEPVQPEGTFSARDMLDYIKVKNTGELDEEAHRQLLGGQPYELRDVPLDQVGEPRGRAGIDPERVNEYAKQPAESSPPVVLGSDSRPIDGKHRVAAALRRGDETIKAYVPVESELGTKPAEGPTFEKATPTPEELAAFAKQNPTLTPEQIAAKMKRQGSEGLARLIQEADAQTATPKDALSEKIDAALAEGDARMAAEAKTPQQVAKQAPAVVRAAVQRAVPIQGTNHKAHVPQLIEEFITPTSSRIKDISAHVFGRLMHMEFSTGVAREALKKERIADATAITEALGGKGSDRYKQAHVAALNGDFDKVFALMGDAKFQENFEAFTNMKKMLRENYLKAGGTMGEIESYWARYIKDFKSFDALYGNGDGRYEEAWDLATKTKGKPLTADEKTQVANMVNQGFGPRKPGSYGPSNVRQRRIAQITPEQAEHYVDFLDASMRYIDQMTYATERAKFFGRGDAPENLADSVGAIVKAEVDGGHG